MLLLTCLLFMFLAAHAKESPLHATKESLSSRPSKPAASKKPSAAGKSAAQRQVLKSTYSSSYGRRPPSAKSLIRPAKSQSSANDYLDSVIGRNAKEGKQTINDSKQQGKFNCFNNMYTYLLGTSLPEASIVYITPLIQSGF